MFSLVFRGLGGEHIVENILLNAPGGAFGAVMAVMIVMFILGFFMDTLEIILITVPVTAPAILTMGVDPVWLGVMIGVNLQTSFLTPPVGFALFYMRSVAPPSILTSDIYRGAIPFVTLQLGAIAVLWIFPQLATWLPKVVFPDAVPAVSESGTSGPSDSVFEQLMNPGPRGPAEIDHHRSPGPDRCWTNC